MPKGKANGEEKAPLTWEQEMGRTVKQIAAKARDINTAVKEYRDGISDLAELRSGIDLSYRKMTRGIQNFLALQATKKEG